MKIILLSFVGGLVVGGLFKVFKFPVPAPSNWAGVAGIVGITAGYMLLEFLTKR